MNVFQRCAIQTYLVRDYQSVNQFIWRFLCTMGHCCQEVREDVFLIVLVFGFKYSFSLDKKSGNKVYISIMYSSFSLAGLEQYEGKQRGSSFSFCSTLIFTNCKISHLKQGALKKIAFMKRCTRAILFLFVFCQKTLGKCFLADDITHQLLLKVWSGGEDTLQPTRRITVTMTAFGTQSKINF